MGLLNSKKPAGLLAKSTLLTEGVNMTNPFGNTAQSTPQFAKPGTVNLPGIVANTIAPGLVSAVKSIESGSSQPYKDWFKTMQKETSSNPRMVGIDGTDYGIDLSEQAENLGNLVLGFGAGAGNLSGRIKTIANSKNPKQIGTLLEEIGVQKEFIPKASKLFSTIDNPERISQILNGTLIPKPAGLLSKAVAQEAQEIPKAGLLARAEVYQGEKDLTTKILRDLEGKSTVSKQYILDATNRGDLKQTERDLIRSMLSDEGNTVNVPDFAKKVKAELLPLKRSITTGDPRMVTKGEDVLGTPHYENIALPDELRGKVKDYQENIYQSPIKTSAGSTHFNNLENKPDGYFGHTRIEDMADNKTRRVIEVQSDLYQKGNLEKEGMVKLTGLTPEQHSVMNKLKTMDEKNAYIKSIQGNLKDKVSKLQQYNNPTAHFRMVREEIKKAAQDGKTKLQFPTGETAMKIEGLGTSHNWSERGSGGVVFDLTPTDLKTGMTVTQGQAGYGQDWIITDVLGDGKFKAVPKDIWERKNNPVGKPFDPTREPNYEGYIESFDISGKVDTNNPIYRFYEKELGRYLTSKYGAKIITDSKGVKWYEIPVSKANSGAIEAFKTYKPFTSGPKYSNEVVEQFIRKTAKELGINNRKLEIYFDKDLIKKISALGEASSYRDVITGELKHVIRLYTSNGKSPVRVGGHELKHVLDRVIGEEAHTKLREETALKMENADFRYYKDRGYKTRNEQIDEFMADEAGKSWANKAGYKSRIQKVIDAINKILNRVISLVKKVYQKFKDTPNKQGGFVRVRGEGGIEPKPTNGVNGNSSSSSSVSIIDKLIAEGKVRVVSREGRDVYQVKKGNTWASVRDEDSAIKQTRPSLSRTLSKNLNPDIELKKADELQNKIEKARLFGRTLKQDNQLLQQAKLRIELKKDQLENSPFNHPDNRLLVDREGRVRELGDLKTPTLIRKLEDRMAEAGINDPREFADGVENYFKQKKELAELERDLRTKPKISEEGVPMSTKALEARAVKSFPSSPLAKKQAPPQIQGEPGEVKSIEIQAKQALELLDGGEIPSGVSLAKIISQTVTPVERKVNIIDTYLRTPDRVMSKIGFGSEAKELRKAMDGYWKELPKNINKVSEWSKQVPKESNERIFKYLDGQAITLRPDELKVAGEIKTWLRQWADRLGLAKDERVSDYITRIFDSELLAKEFDEDLAKLIADKIPGSVYNPFTLRRLGTKGYKQDTWAALDAYVKRGTRKVYMDPVLEKIQSKTGSSLEVSNIEKSQWKYIQNYINNINMRPSELDESIDNVVKSLVGYKFGQRPVTYLTRILRQLTYRGMLGLNPGSALRNLSQGINTYSVLGEKYTAIGYANLLKKGAMDELKREGVLNAGFIQDKVLSATGKIMEKADKGLFIFFDGAEKINRGGAYFGAKAKALAEGETEEQAIEYAKEIVRKTQFVFDSVDTPVGMQSDIMKTLFQFQTFTTKQTEFLLEMAKNKNYLGMLRYAVAGMIFVYTIGKSFGMEPKELLPIYRFDTPPSLKLPKEVVKALVDSPDKYGKDRTIKTKVSDILKTLPGLIPGGTQAKKTYQGINAVNDGGSFTKSGSKQFEVGGTTLKDFQAYLFGKYAGTEAKNYFDKSLSKEEEEYKKAVDEDKKQNSKAKERVMPIYKKAQELKEQGLDEEAQALVDELSDEDYAVYKKIRTAEKTKTTLQGKKDIFPTFQKIQELKSAGNLEEANRILDEMTEEEYKYYELVKKQLDDNAEVGTDAKGNVLDVSF